MLGEALTALGGIVLDDLHFANEATLQLLPELMSPDAPDAWLLVLRPPADGSPAAALLAALAAAEAWKTMALAPLDEAALAEMIDSLALPGLRGDGLAPALCSRSGGNLGQPRGEPAIEPNSLYRAERWLGTALAMAVAGQHRRSRDLAADAWAWVAQHAARLPEPMREAFVHRQAVNQALRCRLAPA